MQPRHSRSGKRLTWRSWCLHNKKFRVAREVADNSTGASYGKKESGEEEIHDTNEDKAVVCKEAIGRRSGRYQKPINDEKTREAKT